MQRSVAPTTARRDQAIRDAALAQTQHAPVKTLDDELVEISDSVPGFGGLFVSGAKIRRTSPTPHRRQNFTTS